MRGWGSSALSSCHCRESRSGNTTGSGAFKGTFSQTFVLPPLEPLEPALPLPPLSPLCGQGKKSPKV